MRELTRYWFRFEPGESYSDLPSGVRLGCGVTAYDDQDAWLLLKQRVFKGSDLPKVIEMVRDVDVSTLDSSHVVPNMEVPIYRGIWFPRGYN